MHVYICRQDTHTHRINVFFKNGVLVPMTSEAHWMLVGLICALLLNWSYGHFRVRSAMAVSTFIEVNIKVNFPIVPL